MDEIPPEVQKGVRAALGERFRHGLVKTVQVETKGEKTDKKILALKNCRAFILSSKSPPKLEHEFNYLELEYIESTKSKQVKLKLQDRKDPFVVTADSQEEVSKIIEFIAESLKRVFPHTPLELFFDVKLEPSDRLHALQNHLDCFSLPDLGPCGGFSQMYQFMCDLHSLPYMEEVAWDIDTIYLSQDSTELCLNDFDHLEAKDLVPILSSLTYNNWFKRLTVKDIRLCRGKGNRSNTINLQQGVEATREVINIIRRSCSLEQLVLHNTGFKSDFAKELATALQANSNSALILLDLSNNHLDDRGLKSLCPAFAKLQNGLVELSLPNTGVTAEGVSALGKALSENNFFPTSLMRLNLSGNVLKDGNIELLLNFLAQPNHLTHLDLSECGIPLDNIFSALFRGCINLTNVNLSGNVYSYKKGKDVTVPQAVKQFFATTTKLQSLNLANCKLFPDAIKEIMLGIGSNRSLENVEVNLQSNELRHEGAKVIASCIANVPNITSLNLSNNDFSVDLGSLMAWISQNKVLAHLDISENFVNVRQKNLQAILDAIVDVIQTETSPIRSLSIARNKLKFETIPIINALGSNTTLTCIDISGNQMGDIGARMLAKALQINCKLETVVLDNNSISPKGFQDIANALERNYSLKSIPPPVADLTSCSKLGGPSWEKAEVAFKRIQVLLQRNHSPQKFADAQAFRLQQGFLYTTSHQLVDKLVVQIQDACKELTDCEDGEVQENIQVATGFIKDADNSKQLLEVLHEESRKNESDDVTQQLKEMANQIHNSVEDKLKKTAEGMINGTKEKCPHVMENQELEESVKAVCKNRSTIPDKFVLGLIEQLNAQLCNQMSEANLAMAAHISDTIIDEIIDKLMNSHQNLGKHLSTYRNRTLSLSLTDINGPKSQDEVDHAEQGPETGDALQSQQFQKKEGQSTPSTSKDNFRDKRKSVKLRPKSVMVHAQDVIQPMPPAEPAPKETAVSATPTPPKKEPAKRAPARAVPNVDLGDFDAISSSSQRPLRDARLDRPRRVRNVRPTRAVAIPQKDSNPGPDGTQEAGGIQDVSEGVDNFFRPVDPELVTPVTQKPKSDTPSKDKKKKEKEEKDKKKKQKDEGKKKKEEKKKGLFGGIFNKRRSSQPASEAKDSSSVKRGSEPPSKSVPEKAKQSPPQEVKLGGVVEEDSEPPTPEYRSSEDELSSKDEDSKSTDAIEKKEEAVEPAPKPAKVALKPMPGKALKPNVLADLKATHAKRKSKELMDVPDGTPNGEVPDPPKNEDKPPPPVKPVASPRTNVSGKSQEETKTPEPVEEQEDAKGDEELKDKEEKPVEEEDVSVPEKTESPKKTLPGGLLVLPPSPVRSNGSARNSLKSEGSDGGEESETTFKSEVAKSPTLHETHKMTGSNTGAPAPNDQKDDVAPDEGDIPFPEVLSQKSETRPSEQSLQSPGNSLTQEAGASSPAKPSSPASPNPPALTQTDSASPVVDEPPAKLSSPTETSKKILPPIQMEPSTKPPSPTKSLSPKSLPSPVPSLDSKPPPSPTKAVNPLFIPKKSNSVQDKSSLGPPSSPRKSASIGARPGNRATAEDKIKEVKGSEDKVEPSVINKEEASVNGDIKGAPEDRVQESEKKIASSPPAETNGKTEKGDEPKSMEKVKEDEKSPKRPPSISERVKNYQNPQAERQEPALSISEKRKSFEQKVPPTAQPRPKSITPKPAPRPKPPVTKRPVSGDKTASPVTSPPGSVIKKAPPVAGRRLLPK